MTTKTGRPKMEDGEKKGKIVGVRLRAGERGELEKAAKRDGKKLSVWAREVLVGAAGMGAVLEELFEPQKPPMNHVMPTEAGGPKPAQIAGQLRAPFFKKGGKLL